MKAVYRRHADVIFSETVNAFVEPLQSTLKPVWMLVSVSTGEPLTYVVSFS